MDGIKNEKEYKKEKKDKHHDPTNINL